MDALDLLKAERDTARDFAVKAWDRVDANLRVILWVGVAILLLATRLFDDPLLAVLEESEKALQGLQKTFQSEQERAQREIMARALGDLRPTTLKRLARPENFADLRSELGKLKNLRTLSEVRDRRLAAEALLEVCLSWVENEADRPAELASTIRDCTALRVEGGQPDELKDPAKLVVALEVLASCCDNEGRKAAEKIQQILGWDGEVTPESYPVETAVFSRLDDNGARDSLSSIAAHLSQLDDFHRQWLERAETDARLNQVSYSQRENPLADELENMKSELASARSGLNDLPVNIQNIPVPVPLLPVFYLFPGFVLLGGIYLGSQIQAALSAVDRYRALSWLLAEKARGSLGSEVAESVKKLRLDFGAGRGIMILLVSTLVCTTLKVIWPYLRSEAATRFYRDLIEYWRVLAIVGLVAVLVFALRPWYWKLRERRGRTARGKKGPRSK